MGKWKTFKGYVAGVLTVLMLAAIMVPVFAQPKTIEVDTGVDIYVDGVKVDPKDANGAPVETFIYAGTTYVPLRAISQILGKQVGWDGENRRALIGEQPGAKQYLADVCPPYQVIGLVAPESFRMGGITFKKGIVCPSYEGGVAWYNLNAKYKTLIFDVGHVDGTPITNTTFKIYLDGELAQEITIDANALPQHIEIPLRNALQMKFEIPRSSGNPSTGIGNIEIY